MGFLGSALGTNSSFNAQPATTQDTTNQGQINGANTQVQSGLGQQQAFVNATQAQNGLNNQSSVYNQLQGITNGTGPNPAMAQLNQTTGQNIASQAALAAGQRGSSANVGLMARQNAMTGAATQQNAVGQAATLQANQSLNALGQQAGVAQNQVTNQAGALQNYNQLAQNSQANLLNAQTSYNNAQMTGQSNANSINAGTAQQNASNNASLIGNVVGSGASMASSILAHGGMAGVDGMQKFADGGTAAPVGVQVTNLGPVAPEMTGSGGNVWGGLSGQGGGQWGGLSGGSGAGGGKSGGGLGGLAALMAQGGPVPLSANMPSDGPCHASNYFNGGAASLNGEAYAQAQKTVPGKASVQGDSYSNDTIPAMLSPGEIIVDREHASDPKKAAMFAYAVAMKNKKGSK